MSNGFLIYKLSAVQCLCISSWKRQLFHQLWFYGSLQISHFLRKNSLKSQKAENFAHSSKR
jgi:hypothetical protein